MVYHCLYYNYIWCYHSLWPHQAKGSTWVYIIECESVQSAGSFYGAECTLSQQIMYTQVDPFALWGHNYTV